MSLKVVILAAGQGTRMCSSLPKVLHQLAGKPLLQWVLDAAVYIKPAQTFVVHGCGSKRVKQAFTNKDVTWIEQAQQLGTGHALQQVLPQLQDHDRVLVLLGDTPLITRMTLNQLIDNTTADAVGIVTSIVTDPSGFGRILRDDNSNIVGIVEERDVHEEQRAITEINTGIMLLPVRPLKAWLHQLANHNAQGEYYLTDIIAMAAADKVAIKAVQPAFSAEVTGVNNRAQLASLERIYETRTAEALMLNGVTLRDPARFDLRGELNVDKDVIIDINVIIDGKVSIERDSTIGANVMLKNVTIGKGVTILPNCMIEDAIIGDDCVIGPFSRLRSGTRLANKVKVGSFVETKKITVGEGSKLPHLSYIGDAKVGKQVNIGAGVVTCNYDGVGKYVTIIGDGAFIGSDSQLIAPVTIGEGAYIAAGSSINKDAPAGKLSIARTRQKTVEHWSSNKKA